jgi:hypothetical protein
MPSIAEDYKIQTRNWKKSNFVSQKSRERTHNESIDIADISNYAFNKMRLEENPSSLNQQKNKFIPEDDVINDSQGSELEEQAMTKYQTRKNNLQISRYPDVVDVPMELYPSKRKFWLAELAQKRNERKFFRENQYHHKVEYMKRFQRELGFKLRKDINYDVPVNAINEKKIKLWD